LSNSIILLSIVFIPAIGGILGAIFLKDKLLEKFVYLISYIQLILCTYIYIQFAFFGYEQISVLYEWINIGKVNVDFYIKLDGLNAPLILLAGILTTVAVHASNHIRERINEYYFWLFLLITGVFGVFLSFDLILFFLYFICQ